MPALLHSPADIISRLLVTKGQGVAPIVGSPTPWQVYVSGEPPTPDQCLTVYDTTSQDDGRSMLTGETWQHYGFQVRIRALDHPTGYVKAEAIHTALDEAVYDEFVTIDGTTYNVHSVSATNLLCLGKEASSSGRRLFTVNGLSSIIRV